MFFLFIRKLNTVSDFWRQWFLSFGMVWTLSIVRIPGTPFWTLRLLPGIADKNYKVAWDVMVSMLQGVNLLNFEIAFLTPWSSEIWDIVKWDCERGAWKVGGTAILCLRAPSRLEPCFQTLLRRWTGRRVPRAASALLLVSSCTFLPRRFSSQARVASSRSAPPFWRALQSFF